MKNIHYKRYLVRTNYTNNTTELYKLNLPEGWTKHR